MDSSETQPIVHISENMEKALTMWQAVEQKIKAGYDPKTQPSRAEIARFYEIPYKTLCHRINGRTSAPGHASGGARRGKIFTVGEYRICYLFIYYISLQITNSIV